MINLHRGKRALRKKRFLCFNLLTEVRTQQLDVRIKKKSCLLYRWCRGACCSLPFVQCTSLPPFNRPIHTRWTIWCTGATGTRPSWASGKRSTSGLYSTVLLTPFHSCNWHHFARPVICHCCYLRSLASWWLFARRFPLWFEQLKPHSPRRLLLLRLRFSMGNLLF